MAVRYKVGDITDVTEGIIAHGVNCQGAMGSGVAKALYTKYPKIREEYVLTNYAGNEALGAVYWVDIRRTDVTVANCYTQEFYGYDGKVYADLLSIERCLSTVFSLAKLGEVDVNIPLIGCGLAGLDWETDVEPVVSRLAKFYSVDCVVHVLNKEQIPNDIYQ